MARGYRLRGPGKDTSKTPMRGTRFVRQGNTGIQSDIQRLQREMKQQAAKGNRTQANKLQQRINSLKKKYGK